MKNTILFLILFLPYLLFAQFSQEKIITTEISGPWYVYATDIDGDGFTDVLSASTGDDTLAWYKNLDGLGNFGPQQTIALLDQTRYIIAADIDGDGDMDVLATTGSINLVVWFENIDGLGNFGTQQIISTDLLLPKMVIAGDVDSDGDLDVIIASNADNKVTWFENLDGLGTFGTQQIISNSALTPTSIFFADIDSDGFGDVISESSINNFPCWYKNLDGLGNFGPQQEITNDTSGSIYVIADDVDGDGDMDILNLEFGGNTISWFENTDGQGAFGPKQIITTDVNAPRQIFMADLDNDGDQDIIYNSQEVIDPEFIAWQENDGLGDFGEQQIITTNVIAPLGLFAADLDNDGDMDVLSSSLADNKIAWYENYFILGIEESLEIKIKVHPNPANTILYITNTSAYIINLIEIYDVMGRVAKKEQENKSQLDISQLQAGVYFVKIITDKGELVKKIIKE